jgi:hypothetical protein
MNDKNLYFKNKNGEIVYNELCVKCPYNCKQSFRSIIVSCNFTKKNKKRR